MITTAPAGDRRPTGRPPQQPRPALAQRGAAVLGGDGRGPGQAGKGGASPSSWRWSSVPLYTIVLTSFSTQESVNKAGGMVLVPHGLTLERVPADLQQPARRALAAGQPGVTVVGTVLSMVVTVLCAYGLSRPRSFGHRTHPVAPGRHDVLQRRADPDASWWSPALGGYGKYWSLILPSAVSRVQHPGDAGVLRRAPRRS